MTTTAQHCWCAPFREGCAGCPSNTMSPGWDLPLYQVASWSIQPLATIHQCYRQGRHKGQQSNNRGWTVLEMVAQKWNMRLNKCWQFSCPSCHPTNSLNQWRELKRLTPSKENRPLGSSCQNPPTHSRRNVPAIPRHVSTRIYTIQASMHASHPRKGYK